MSTDEANELETINSEEGIEENEEPKELPQEVEITSLGSCRKHVKVTVAREAIETLKDEKFRELVLNSPTNVPGFRPGKAPRKIIEKKYNKAVSEEVKNNILMVSLEQLAGSENLAPLSPPDFDPKAVIIPDEGPLVYEFEVEVRPEFDLPDYKGLTIRKPVHTYTDEEIARDTARLLERYGQIVPKDGPVAEEDIITADFEIEHEGNSLAHFKEVQVKVEKTLALHDAISEEFAKSLEGANSGETRSVPLVLSQGISDEALQGKTVQAKVTIHDIKTVRQTELTPDILEEFGVRTPEQFDELVRARLDRYLELRQRQTARQQVFEQLAGKIEWDLPQDMLLRQSRTTLQRQMMEMRAGGMTDEQITGQMRRLQQNAVASTAASLKQHFVLQKIAELEKIEIKDEDIDDEIDRIADQTEESPRKVRARLERDELIETLASDLLERSALDLVLDEARYEEYDFSPEQDIEGDVASLDLSVMG